MVSSSPARKALARFVPATALGLALAFGCAAPASAAQYTPQEKANIEAVRSLFADLDASEARDDQAAAIDGIAAKHMSADFVQHTRNGDRTRDGWAALFKRPKPAPAPGTAPAPRQPSKEAVVMANGDYVIHLAGRGENPNTFTWHMFRVKDGILVEEW